MAKADFKKIAIVYKYWTPGVSASSLRNIATAPQSLEETMSIKIRIPSSMKTAQEFLRWMRLSSLIPAVCLLFPMVALAQSGSPFDTGFTSIQTLFTLAALVFRSQKALADIRASASRTSIVQLVRDARATHSHNFFVLPPND